APESLEAHIALWTLLDLTGRSHMAEQVFWRAYELSPPREKVSPLREWFIGQFFPASSRLEFDQMIGIISEEQPYSERTEAYRYIRFRNQEPESPLGYV